jgi:hypothetical protein
MKDTKTFKIPKHLRYYLKYLGLCKINGTSEKKSYFGYFGFKVLFVTSSYL